MEHPALRSVNGQAGNGAVDVLQLLDRSVTAHGVAAEATVEILVAHDDLAFAQLAVQHLEEEGYSCIVASGPAAAGELLEQHDIAVAICGMDFGTGPTGLDMIRHISRVHPQTAAVLVTGTDDMGLCEAAIEAGAFGYIMDPFQMGQLVVDVAMALRRRSMWRESAQQRDVLQGAVRRSASGLEDALEELGRSEEKLHAMHEELISRLAVAAEFHDTETGAHVKRMSAYSGAIASSLGLDPEHRRLIRIGSAVHDIGKLGIPDRILLKPGPLEGAERRIMERHAEIGRNILDKSGAELVQVAALIAWTHHERYNGSGYPRGLSGTDIPLEGRIAAAADVYDALMSQRPYRPAMRPEAAKSYLERHAGTLFDPDVVAALLS